ncbi:DEAD/DEAH box helicase [archaeon]|jgi:DNA repair protein RadD|nr:DEAD/DEAH box helicase [archaeon]MBT7128624.1 DEAD/DEAH box helicase [archaeon]
MSVWKFLGKSDLQKYLEDELLERLEDLLPIFDPNIDGFTIHSKNTLAKIFESFIAPRLFSKKEFRAQLLNSFPESNLDDICILLEIKITGLSFDKKVKALCKIPWKESKRVDQFLEALNLPLDFGPSEKQLPEKEKIISLDIKRYLTLKDFQASVFYKVVDELKNPRARFIVQMPTGSGKTRTAMEIISSVLNDNEEKSIVIWLAHSEELCEQAYQCFEDTWYHTKNKDLKLIRSWGEGGSLPQDADQSCMIIGGFQKLYAILKKDPSYFDKLRSHVKLIVVDEAHKVLAPTYKKVTDSLIGDDTCMIGLTATPGRSIIDEDQNKDLANYFFQKIINIDTGKEPVIKYLRDRKILARTNYHPIKTNRTYELTKKEQEHLEKFFDLPKGILKRIGADDARNIEIIKILQDDCALNKQILFFACSVEHSQFITALLNMLGIKAAHVDGELPKGRRAAIINEFRENKIQVLCNYGVLSTGFDAPKIDVVFISRPTGSVVLYSQMIGRGLRGPSIGGTEECKIVDLIDNITGFGNEDKVYEYFDEYYS